MKVAKIDCKFLSSLEKMFFDFPKDAIEKNSGSMLKNERYSFQLAIYLETVKDWRIKFRFEIESELKEFIRMFAVDYVPSMVPALPRELSDEDYLSKRPGLFPDPLRELYDNTYTIYHEEARAIWFTVEPNGTITGTHPIKIKILDDDEVLVKELVYELHIIDKDLPEQELINTCWFHGDSLAALHRVEIGSEPYFELTEKYLEIYTGFGHNMILTPVFTPPLDTDPGAERPTNQLVDVTQTDGVYTFGFDRLGRWIDLCQKHGIKYFEISHLFTQWGAEFTPKIMATVDGEYQRIFGWDVAALSEEYIAFLDAFMPQLVDYLKKKGVYDRSFFHASDEPHGEHEVQYAKVCELMKKYVEDEHRIEALSDYGFYEKGYITKPVVPTDFIDPFLDHGIENLWTYYCCGEGNKVANRFMAMPSYRNRILGCQLYKNRIEGFLQWGFNFWFSERARRVINPYYSTDAGEGFPSGDAFVVYPLDDQGNVVVSLRLYVFYEGLQDLRALKLLESLTDRETVENLLTEVTRFDTYPRNGEYLLSLRETVNQMIEKHL